MSPEQAQGKEIDHRSDLFSLGVVVYELITRHNPFKRDGEAATLSAVMIDKPEPLARYKSNVPQSLELIALKLLEKNPGHRYQNAAEVISDLRKLMEIGLSEFKQEDQKPSIAVLPFSNLSADPEQEYFCDGMAEEIINALTHLEGLRVVARTSCFAFKGKHDDIREIGRKLNVDHVLEGSVRKAGNRVRITGQLIKISDGFHLWSDRFDRDLEDIFEIQDEISQRIVEKLRVKLLEVDRGQMIKKPTENLEAYNLYLKGRHFWNRRIKSYLHKSVDCFKQAIQCDAGFALGYAGLADAYAIFADFEHSNRHEHMKLAEQYSLAALELDDALAEPHATLGMVKFDQWKWSEAEEEFKRAIELNPSYATAHQWYGLYLIEMRRLSQAKKQLALARELDPLSPALIIAQSVYFYTAREYDKVMDTCKEGIELGPNASFNMITGWSLIEKGDYKAAIDQLKQASELSRQESSGESVHPYISVFMGRSYVLMGEVEKAQRILDNYLEEAESSRVSPTAIASLYICLGDNDLGIEWLEKSSSDLDDWLPVFSLWPIFDPVRDDPRFISLLSRVGLSNRPEGGWNE
jgi:TolB-like protein/Flp pilus assembly protein TadD